MKLLAKDPALTATRPPTTCAPTSDASVRGPRSPRRRSWPPPPVARAAPPPSQIDFGSFEDGRYVEPPRRTGFFLLLTLLMFAAVGLGLYYVSQQLDDEQRRVDRRGPQRRPGRTATGPPDAAGGPGFRVQVQEEASAEVAVDVVIRQDPAAGTDAEGLDGDHRGQRRGAERGRCPTSSARTSSPPPRRSRRAGLPSSPRSRPRIRAGSVHRGPGLAAEPGRGHRGSGRFDRDHPRRARPRRPRPRRRTLPPAPTLPPATAPPATATAPPRRAAVPGGRAQAIEAPVRSEEGAQELVAVLGEDRLGVELDALDVELAVAQAHDHAVVGAGGDLEHVGHRLGRRRPASGSGWPRAGRGGRRTRRRPRGAMGEVLPCMIDGARTTSPP